MRLPVRWWLQHVEELVACALLVLITTVAAWNVLMRYALNAPVMWADELNRFAFIWMCYFGAVVATKRRAHLRVELIDGLLKGAVGRGVRIIIHMLSVLTLLTVTYFGVEIVIRTWSTATAVLRVPQGVIYLPLPLCTLLMSLYLIRDLFALLRPHRRSGTDREGGAAIA